MREIRLFVVDFQRRGFLLSSFRLFVELRHSRNCTCHYGMTQQRSPVGRYRIPEQYHCALDMHFAPARGRYLRRLFQSVNAIVESVELGIEWQFNVPGC
jgi:hypothetical protein